ncbi:hypothetical protein KGF56_003845 [Candida oxycetoniae]|uniref:SMP-LTD domain-containing protein n=1 Tax=Candida oxycetoniae TaxID=497107 RepID=A0AAI9SUN6_9ASCO|nr:uncharacterized protein KGF56_003845 [Candida oxycetoniae]KAI3403257.2 hypothetical protein KGF56_003845 [Candida oxycetoniae]
MGLISFFLTYLCGLVSFPLIIILIFHYLLPSEKDHQDNDYNIEDDGVILKAGEIEEKHQSGLESFKLGWIVVTNDYIESTDEINKNTTSITESPETKSAYASLFKLVNKQQQQQQQQSSSNSQQQQQPLDLTDPSHNEFGGDDTTCEVTSIASSLRNTQSSPPLNPQQPPSQPQPPAQHPQQVTRNSLKKHRFFAVLKHGNLFLYKDQSLKDVKHVIVLNNYFVTIWPRELSDAQLFTKYTAIALINPTKFATSVSKSSNNNNGSSPPGSFFIYCDTTSDKEDWYFALIRSTKLDSYISTSASATTTTTTTAMPHSSSSATATISSSSFPSSSSSSSSTTVPCNLSATKYAQTLHFSTKDMINLIQALYSSEGHLQTKWMNALIGRWFLAIKDTKYFENYIYTKLKKKLNKIKKPGFFDTFQITEIHPGNSAPFFTYPNLKEINPDGTLVVSSNISYTGGISVAIKTKLDLTFGTKFTTKEVDLLLKISLMNLEGPLLIKLKPPPSNRFWYCYEIEPIMNIKVEPILSNKSLNYSFITSSIEKKFKEAIKESLVLPHWDDIVFYDTSKELYRGGIWKPNKDTNCNGDKTTTVSDGRDKSNVYDDDDDDNDDASSSMLREDDNIELKSRSSNRSLRSSKIGTTFTDLTKKMKAKKGSSLHDEEFSNTTTSTAAKSVNEHGVMSNTFKKIGKWYFKDDNKQQQQQQQQQQEQLQQKQEPQQQEQEQEQQQQEQQQQQQQQQPSQTIFEGKPPLHQQQQHQHQHQQQQPKRSVSSNSSSMPSSEMYHPPEMISNRRPRRKTSNANSVISSMSGKVNSTLPQTTTNSFDAVKSGTISPAEITSSPSFNFARFDNTSDNFLIPPAPAPAPEPEVAPPMPPRPSSSVTNLLGNSTAGSLSASGLFNAINNLPSSPTLKDKSSNGNGNGSGNGSDTVSRSDSFPALNLSETTYDVKKQSLSVPTSEAGMLTGEPTVGLSQPSSPKRSKTLSRKPPPKSPSLNTTASVSVGVNDNGIPK